MNQFEGQKWNRTEEEIINTECNESFELFKIARELKLK